MENQRLVQKHLEETPRRIKLDCLIEGFAHLLDRLYVVVVIGSLVVFWWVGTWFLIDTFFFADCPTKQQRETENTDLGQFASTRQNGRCFAEESSALASQIGGMITLFICIASQNIMTRNITVRSIAWCICPRIYTYIFALAMLNIWRGTWGLASLYHGYSVQLYGLILTGCILLVMLLRVTFLLVSAPIGICLDTDITYYYAFTRFRDDTDSYVIRGAQIACSVCLVSVVALAWFCGFALMENFLFPRNLVSTALCSLAVSGILIALLLILSTPACWIAARLTRLGTRLILDDCWQILAFAASLVFWKGIWILYENMFSDARVYIVTHVVTSLVLTMSLCAGSLGIAAFRTRTVDGEWGNDTEKFHLPLYFYQLRPDRQKDTAIN